MPAPDLATESYASTRASLYLNDAPTRADSPLRRKHLIRMMQEDEKQGLYQIPPKKEGLFKHIFRILKYKLRKKL